MIEIIENSIYDDIIEQNNSENTSPVARTMSMRSSDGGTTLTPSVSPKETTPTGPTPSPESQVDSYGNVHLMWPKPKSSAAAPLSLWSGIDLDNTNSSYYKVYSRSNTSGNIINLNDIKVSYPSGKYEDGDTDITKTPTIKINCDSNDESYYIAYEVTDVFYDDLNAILGGTGNWLGNLSYYFEWSINNGEKASETVTTYPYGTDQPGVEQINHFYRVPVQLKLRSNRYTELNNALETAAQNGKESITLHTYVYAYTTNNTNVKIRFFGRRELQVTIHAQSSVDLTAASYGIDTWISGEAPEDNKYDYKYFSTYDLDGNVNHLPSAKGTNMYKNGVVYYDSYNGHLNLIKKHNGGVNYLYASRRESDNGSRAQAIPIAKLTVTDSLSLPSPNDIYWTDKNTLWHNTGTTEIKLTGSEDVRSVIVDIANNDQNISLKLNDKGHTLSSKVTAKFKYASQTYTTYFKNCWGYGDAEDDTFRAPGISTSLKGISTSIIQEEGAQLHKQYFYDEKDTHMETPYLRWYPVLNTERNSDGSVDGTLKIEFLNPLSSNMPLTFETIRYQRDVDNEHDECKLTGGWANFGENYWNDNRYTNDGDELTKPKRTIKIIGGEISDKDVTLDAEYIVKPIDTNTACVEVIKSDGKVVIKPKAQGTCDIYVSYKGVVSKEKLCTVAVAEAAPALGYVPDALSIESNTNSSELAHVSDTNVGENNKWKFWLAVDEDNNGETYTIPDTELKLIKTYTKPEASFTFSNFNSKPTIELVNSDYNDFLNGHIKDTFTHSIEAETDSSGKYNGTIEIKIDCTKAHGTNSTGGVGYGEDAYYFEENFKAGTSKNLMFIVKDGETTISTYTITVTNNNTPYYERYSTHPNNMSYIFYVNSKSPEDAISISGNVITAHKMTSNDQLGTGMPHIDVYAKYKNGSEVRVGSGYVINASLPTLTTNGSISVGNGNLNEIVTSSQISGYLRYNDKKPYSQPTITAKYNYGTATMKCGFAGFRLASNINSTTSVDISVDDDTVAGVYENEGDDATKTIKCTGVSPSKVKNFYLKCIKPGRVTLTVTGGRDSLGNAYSKSETINITDGREDEDKTAETSWGATPSGILSIVKDGDKLSITATKTQATKTQATLTAKYDGKSINIGNIDVYPGPAVGTYSSNKITVSNNTNVTGFEIVANEIPVSSLVKISGIGGCGLPNLIMSYGNLVSGEITIPYSNFITRPTSVSIINEANNQAFSDMGWVVDGTLDNEGKYYNGEIKLTLNPSNIIKELDASAANETYNIGVTIEESAANNPSINVYKNEQNITIDNNWKKVIKKIYTTNDIYVLTSDSTTTLAPPTTIIPDTPDTAPEVYEMINDDHRRILWNKTKQVSPQKLQITIDVKEGNSSITSTTTTPQPSTTSTSTDQPSTTSTSTDQPSTTPSIPSYFGAAYALYNSFYNTADIYTTPGDILLGRVFGSTYSFERIHSQSTVPPSLSTTTSTVPPSTTSSTDQPSTTSSTDQPSTTSSTDQPSETPETVSPETVSPETVSPESSSTSSTTTITPPSETPETVSPGE